MSFRREPRRNPVAWIVAADRALAKIYAANWPALDGFQLIETLDNPEGQMMGRELNADGAGRERASYGPAHSFVWPTDHRHATAQKFADEIVTRLEQGRNENEFGHLILLAPSLMLGELRNRFSGPLQKIVEIDVDKTIVQLKDNDIAAHARKALAAVAAVV